MWNAIAITIHLVAINIWVGGTFFAVVMLPRAVSRLAPAQQSIVMTRVLRRFFYWIWLVVVLLLSSGGWMIYNVFGGLHSAPLYILSMASIGILMVLLFMVIFFGPYRRYKMACQLPDAVAAQRQLERIRRLSAVNMVLGLCVVVTIGLGSYFAAP